MSDHEKGSLMVERLAMNHSTSEGDYKRACAKHATFFRHNYRRHMPRDRASRVLDVGCGLGHFLHFCREEGYSEVQGIDLSLESVAFCREQGFVAEERDALEFLEAADRIFDVIVLNDVIEHIPKPELFRFVDALLGALVPGGVLILKTINSANPITGPHGRYLDLTHETSWTEESMQQVLGFRGFSDIRVLPSNLYVFYSNPLNYVGLVASKMLEWIFLLIFRLNGRNLTKVFTKNLLAVASRPADGAEPPARLSIGGS